MDLEIGLSTLEQIRMLPSELRKKLSSETIDWLYDESWCELYKIDYVNPDFIKAAEIVFLNKYQDKIPNVISTPTSEELQLR